MKDVQDNVVELTEAQNRGQRRKADIIIHQLATGLTKTAGVSLAIAVERLLVFATAQMVSDIGKDGASNSLQSMLDALEEGTFDRFDGASFVDRQVRH